MEESIEKVNELIKKTFGNNYEGNYVSKKGICNVPKKSGKLDEIWKENFLMYVYIGKFNLDEDKLEIHSKRYRRKAKRFAGLYKRDIGREIEIIFED
jgi:hypothetical protein